MEGGQRKRQLKDNGEESAISSQVLCSKKVMPKGYPDSKNLVIACFVGRYYLMTVYRNHLEILAFQIPSKLSHAAAGHA